MTRRELFVFLVLATALVLMTVAVNVFGAGHEAVMTPDQQFELAKLRLQAASQQSRLENLPLIFTALGTLLTGLVAVVGFIWTKTASVIKSNKEVTKLVVDEVVPGVAKLEQSHEALAKAVDGLAHRAEEAAGKVGEAKGEKAEREVGEAKAELAAVQSRADIQAVQSKADLAALAAVQRPASSAAPPTGIVPSTEPTSVRIAEAIEGVPEAIDKVTDKVAERDDPKPKGG